MASQPDITLEKYRRHQVITEWSLLIGALLCLGIFIVVTLHVEYKSTDIRERESLSAQLRIVNDNLVSQLDSVNRTLGSLRDYVTRWRHSHVVVPPNRLLSSFSDAIPGVRTITVFDAQGFVIASSRPELIGRNFGDRPYFKVIEEKPNPDVFYIGAPVYTSSNFWSIVVSRALLGPKGEFAGTVNATLDPEGFNILLESVRYSKDIYVALNHGEGTIFLSAPRRDDIGHVSGNGNNESDGSNRNLVVSHLGSGSEQNIFFGANDIAGNERMIAMRTIQPPHLHMNKPLVLTISRERRAQLESWLEMVWAEGGLFLLFASTCIGGLVHFQHRRSLTLIKEAKTEAALDEKTAEVERFFSVSIDMLTLADKDGHFVKINPAWEQTLGYKAADYEGTYILDCIHPDDHEITNEAFSALGRGAKVTGFTNRFRATNGEYHYIEWLSVSVPETGLIYGAARDVTEQRKTAVTMQAMNAKLQAQAELLRTQAYIDGLTGVANRRRFDEAFATEWRNSRREGAALAVLMIDIDHFKLYNDNYGHQAGDEALIAVATALKKGFGRPHDLVARYGGEEFVCLLPKIDLTGARNKAEELRKAVQSLAIANAHSPTADVVTISVGVALRVPNDTSPAEDLIAAADAALYSAKSSGRNRVYSAVG